MSEKQTIVMMGTLPRPYMNKLKEKYDIHLWWKVLNKTSFLAEKGKDVTAIIATAWNGVDAEVIESFPNLKIISNFGVGYDNIDIESAKERGIVVTNTPDVLTNDTADFALALLLSVSRKIVIGDSYIRSGDWENKGMMPLGRSVGGKVIGVVGMGRIGQAISKRAEAFGMRILYTGPNKKDVDYTYIQDLAELAKKSDFLVLSCPARPETENLINLNVLRELGEEGVLINISRGSVVSEADLIEALENNIIAGAGLDVFVNEPSVPESLRVLPQVVLQPHQGSATQEARYEMAQLVLDNLSKYIETGKALTPVF